MRGPRDPEFLNSVAKRTGVETEHLGCPARAGDDPVRLLKNPENMFAFHRLKAGRAVVRTVSGRGYVGMIQDGCGIGPSSAAETAGMAPARHPGAMSSVGSVGQMTAHSSTFSSSRTLPGQEYSCSRCIVS